MAAVVAPPLLFVHGFLGSADDWLPVRELLESPLETATFELPGHGAAAPLALPEAMLPEAGSWLSSTVQLLRARCERLAGSAGGRPLLVGYSMGGRVALTTAVRHPAAIGGLIVIAADPGIEDPAARAERQRRDAALAEQLLVATPAQFEDWLRRWYAAPLFGAVHEHRSFAALLQRRLHLNPAHMAAAMLGLSVAAQAPLWAQLAQLPVPALYVAGAMDTKYRRLGARLAALGGGWQVRECPAAAHAVHVQQPTCLAQFIREFVATTGAVAAHGSPRHTSGDKEHP